MTDMTGKAAGAAGDGGSTAPEPTQAEIDAWAARETRAARGVAERPDRRGARGIRPAPPAAPPGATLRRGRGAHHGYASGRACATAARRSWPPRARWRCSIASRGGPSPSSSGPVANGRRRPPSRPGAAASRWMTRVPEGSSSAPGPRVALESRLRHRPADPSPLIGPTPHEDAVQAPAPGLARPRRLLPSSSSPRRSTCRGADRRSGPGPDAPRLRAAGRRLDQARPDARAALRPAAGGLLRRAVQAAEPGRAVLVRRGPRDHHARSSAPTPRRSSSRSATSRSRPPRSARSTGPSCTAASRSR